ncbi:MAG TPA: class I SAM-dependent methyltransferase [Rubrobacteraceae bacterium]|nr:class I SAM-dependent methyltransferase [Rubrobacteraceae bacterium]
MRSRRFAGAAGVAALVVAAAGVAALWWRRNPSACPYSQRLWVELPRPFITRERLKEILAPKPGERMLEVGPGTGYYALDAAHWIEPDGTLDILDIQQEMLDHTMRRALQEGISNIVPTRGDAQALPYPADTFDAAYLITVLGEVPDQDRALRELRRVIKPGGRLVVGEIFPDPHMVAFGKLRARAGSAGFRFERRIGRPHGYYARFAA